MTSSRIPSHVLHEAAEWFALLRSGDASENDTRHWQAWLAQDPSHKLGWQRVEKIEAQFRAATGQHPESTATTLNQLQSNRIHRRSLIKNAALAIGTLSFGLGGWHYGNVAQLIAHRSAQYQTGVGEIRSLTLPDGTQLWLNTNTAINTAMNGEKSEIHLLHGEILVETNKQSPFPLIVQTSEGTLQPLGTRFTVRKPSTDTHHNQTFVAVYEGAVRVTTHHAQSITVPQHHQTTFTSVAVSALSAASPRREYWHKGILLADDVRLDDLINELNQHQHGYINVSADAAQLHVFGAFPLSQPDTVFTMLANALPITVSRPFPGWINIQVEKHHIH